MTAHCNRTVTQRPPTLGWNPLKDTTTGDRSATPATPPRQRRRPAQLCHAHVASSASASSPARPSYSLSLSASLVPLSTPLPASLSLSPSQLSLSQPLCGFHAGTPSPSQPLCLSCKGVVLFL
ncbi:hypothetical protein FH972_015889 [Carpinus fangiana]|uniref:Uncharacterized protein n=1 Tax=Carpinus fangiana TaxID=176857 RepID=A0A5N6RHM0_9ROSI|nr:hypothetical protein FH972_015889 [Carpinus fangiana]